MKIRESHLHHRVRKPQWPLGMFYLLECIGRFIIIAKDEFGKQVQFNRDDMDKDWVDCGNYDQEGHHVR